MSEQEESVPPTPKNHCNYFVVRKKRYCRVSPKVGEEFCGEHQKAEEIPANQVVEGDTRIRIVCPLDRKHTCYAHNLKKHLKICNAAKDLNKDEPFISKDVNSGRDLSDGVCDDDAFKLLSTFEASDVKKTIEKVNQVYQDVVQNKLTEKILKHSIVEEELRKPEYGDKTKKHLIQASAILGILKDYDLMQDKTCYIEFGAGRGQLSYWIVQATEFELGNDANSSVLLIEKASPKHKRDNKLAKTTDKVQRIRADICDLVLDKVEIINKSEKVVGVCKHLCGGATDLALRCLGNVAENKAKVTGAVMTFCCHHRCRWTVYTGKDFFQENNLSKLDFEIMCGVTSWATCGDGFSRERRQQESAEENKGAFNLKDTELGLDKEAKEEVGRRCKNVLNYGRLRYLEKMGFSCALHYYVEKSISLENVCIVAFK